MLKKIIAIRNVGTFRHSRASGNTQLGRFTLVHAENGRGKSTLCAILRSLQNGNPQIIAERQTLDSNDAPHVEILFDAGVVTFKNGAWDSKCEHIEIFDTAFVMANVYSGDLITHEHKRNLCRVVLGAEGVRLAEKFDDLDSQVRVIGNELADATDALQKLVPTGLTIEQFIALEKDSEVDRKISDKKAELAVLADADAIRQTGSLSTLELPPLPETLAAILQKTIDGISADADRLVHQHIAKHKMAGRGETWLAEGLQYLTSDDCPLCAQPVSGSRVINVFKTFFSQAYRSFHQQIAGFKAAIDQPLSDTSLLAAQKRIAANATLVEFWKKYTAEAPPSLSFDETIQSVVYRLREALEPLTAQKLASPLEPIDLSPEATTGIDDWKLMQIEVQRYNEQVRRFNADVAKVKTASGSKDASTLRQQLAMLEAQKLRHDATVAAAVMAYERAKARKAAAEAAKEQAKRDLDAYNVTVIDQYRNAVNEFLGRFGAAFTLSKVRIEYTGRTPRTAYTFGIRGKDVDPGGENTPPGTVCFRNTLSSGDRSTLALAFFLAQLKTRKDLDRLVVVFDDPFTSLDSFRQHWTCNAIRKLATEAKQVIVLSHSLDFLRRLAERCDKGALRTLQLDRHNKIDSHIIDLDLNDATAPLAEKDVVQLRSYHFGDDKDAPKTIRCIRPVLENHMRKMAPDHCPKGNGWLGTFLGEINKPDSPPALAVFKPIYDDLDSLNSYTSPYAHDSGDAPAIDPSELATAVGLTLRLIGRA